MASVLKFPRGVGREGQIRRLSAICLALPPEKAWKVTVEEDRPRRSDNQNRYLWGACYPSILKHLPGWDAEDVHEWCLGEHFGWEMIEGLGKRRLRPIRRSSNLSKIEFMDYVEWMQRTMAARGIIIPDPSESGAA